MNNYDDPQTWALIQEGRTKGCFQIESALCKAWCKKILPSSIEELSAVISLIRPGALEAEFDGANFPTHYARRKNGLEAIEYKYECLRPALESTYGILCIHEDTWISTYSGKDIQVKNLLPGTEVISVNTNTLKTEKDTCVAVKPSRIDDAYELYLENGNKVILTKDHKVLTYSGWKEVQDLNKEIDSIACPKYIVTDIQNTTLEYDCISKSSLSCSYLFGQLYGDGNKGQNISTGTKENHDILYKWIQNNTNLILKEYFNTRSWYISLHSMDMLRDKNYGRRKTKYRYIIEQLGLDKTCTDKKIPKEIFTTTSENRRAFLAGLFDSDGYSGISSEEGNTSVFHFCSGTKDTIIDIKKLLLMDGIISYVDPAGIHIHIKNTAKFWNLIGPYCILKKNRGKLLGDESFGYVPQKWVKDHLKKNYSGIRTYFRKVENPICTRSTLIKKYGLIQQRYAESIGMNFGEIKYIRIKSIKQLPEKQQFYSLSINNNHNFIGNNIVLKNCYQEEILQIVKDVAGFTLQEADTLRKAAGKKLPEEMAKVKKLFIEGCNKTKIVTEEQAQEIFDWIEKSQRYLFVRAHGIAYAILGYETAYLKAHHPIEFYTGWLRHAHEKIDPLQEKAELISDAKMAGIDVCVPDMRDLKETFYIKGGKIYVGLGNVKSVGESQTKKIVKTLEGVNLAEMSWYQFLRDYSSKINKTAITNLVSVGAFDYLGIARNKMLYEYDIWSKVMGSKVAIEFLKDKPFDNLIDALKACAKPKSEGGGASNKNKAEEFLDLVKVLENPPYSIEDTPGWIAEKEKNLLGISITFHSVDDCDTQTANCTCKDFLGGYNNENINIAVELTRVAEYTTAKGKNPGQLMAFLTGSDSTGLLDSITCFPAEYATFKELLTEGNTILISGIRSRQNSLIVKVVHQI